MNVEIIYEQFDSEKWFADRNYPELGENWDYIYVEIIDGIEKSIAKVNRFLQERFIPFDSREILSRLFENVNMTEAKFCANLKNGKLKVIVLVQN